MNTTRTLLALALAAVALTACSNNEACPPVSGNPDGSYTISAPTGKAAQDRSRLEGCEYEFDEDGNLGTERDRDG